MRHVRHESYRLPRSSRPVGRCGGGSITGVCVRCVILEDTEAVAKDTEAVAKDTEAVAKDTEAVA